MSVPTGMMDDIWRASTIPWVNLKEPANRELGMMTLAMLEVGVWSRGAVVALVGSIQSSTPTAGVGRCPGHSVSRKHPWPHPVLNRTQ